MTWNPYQNPWAKLASSAKQDEEYQKEYGKNYILWDRIELSLLVNNQPQEWDDLDKPTRLGCEVMGQTIVEILRQREVRTRTQVHLYRYKILETRTTNARL